MLKVIIQFLKGSWVGFSRCIATSNHKKSLDNITILELKLNESNGTASNSVDFYKKAYESGHSGQVKEYSAPLIKLVIK